MAGFLPESNLSDAFSKANLASPIIACFEVKGNQKMQQKQLAVGVSLIMLIAMMALAQQTPADKSKRPSPPATAEVTLKNKKVTIDYSRPSLKGRKVGQELAPYGEVWRTGANEATTLNTEIDLNIGGVNVPAGKYTLYTVPSEGTWKLKKTALPQSVEQFTISFGKKNESTADLNLDWGNTRVYVEIKAP
jgi:hypothetical protein